MGTVCFAWAQKTVAARPRPAISPATAPRAAASRPATTPGRPDRAARRHPGDGLTRPPCLPAACPAPSLVLGGVSFCNDLASRWSPCSFPCCSPLSTGAGPVVLGAIEGLADAVAAALKLWAGRRSDLWGGRRPFVLAGYGLSNLVRPLLGIAGSWPAVAALRSLDRVGKGLRTAPRDAPPRRCHPLKSAAGPAASTAPWTTAAPWPAPLFAAALPLPGRPFLWPGDPRLRCSRRPRRPAVALHRRLPCRRTAPTAAPPLA